MSLLDDLLTTAVKNSFEKNKRKDKEPSILGALKDPQFLQDMKRGVLDSVNRGAVASTIGGPVDLATMLMRPLGYNVEKPTGGSEWVGDKMQQLGLLGDTRNPIAEAIASVAVPGAMAKVAPKVFQAEQAAIKNAQMPSPMNGALRNQAGAIVWHGSPHKFDKFDSSKIGTGEGAQAYGHGIYTAESQGVGQSYKEALSGSSKNKFMLGDGEFSTVGGNPEWLNFHKLAKDQGFSDESAALAYHKLRQHGGDLDAASGELRWSDNPHPAWDEAANLLAKSQYKPEGGYLYKVDLPDEQIAKMLDWDKPLSQQAPENQKVLRDLASRITREESNSQWLLKNGNDPHTGALIKQLAYEWPTANMGDSYIGSAEISQELKQQGIPGIRYLDGGSRGTGQGTSNFVVFPGNEDMLKILERNGQPMGLLGQ